MKQQRRFIQCDVFSALPGKGNALAVVLDGDGLTDEVMQNFARWTNLAETTFLFPPETKEGDYRVRIFTPSREMPFAGHPTLGSCAAWLHVGGKPKQNALVRQECGVGIVEIDLSGSVPAFIAPPTKVSSMSSAKCAELITKLKINPDHMVRNAVLNNGPEWHVFELQTAEQVLAVDSSLVRWPSEKAIGLIGPHNKPTNNIDEACDFEVRMLAPSSGMSEDPITGSLNSALAHWQYSLGALDRAVVVAQGTKINRLGRVYITPDPSISGKVSIGGQSHIVVEGSVIL